jgi:hypothetical protein
MIAPAGSSTTIAASVIANLKQMARLSIQAGAIPIFLSMPRPSSRSTSRERRLRGQDSARPRLFSSHTRSRGDASLGHGWSSGVAAQRKRQTLAGRQTY